MKTLGIWAILLWLLAISQARAYSEYLFVDQQLVQVRFDGLIPTFYPTITPEFNALRPTTWPLIYPGVPQVHITENLVHPTDDAILIVN